LPSYEETTCCPAGFSSCEAALGIAEFGRLCCPPAYACCTLQTTSGWSAYCGYPDCGEALEAAPRPGTATTR
jgi:hypothetical protein